MPSLSAAHWLDLLDEEEHAFIRRFILASGSLKELAQTYGVSYPTVRLRLDRLIQRIEVFEKFQERSETERLLRAYYADGKIPDAAFRALLLSLQPSPSTP
jgi:hypothetical protein